MSMKITLDKLIRMAESAKFEADEANRAAQEAKNWITTSMEHAIKAQYDADQISQALAAANEGRLTIITPAMMAAHYPDGECPDCGDPIPVDMVEGGECGNCGHVFWSAPKEEDD